MSDLHTESHAGFAPAERMDEIRLVTAQPKPHSKVKCGSVVDWPLTKFAVVPRKSLQSRFRQNHTH